MPDFKFFLIFFYFFCRYSKRFSEPSYYYPEAAALQIPQHSLMGGIKRGFRSANDPRNLFRAVYGYKK